jgi:DNA-binding MarR family transcriptional regulator
MEKKNVLPLALTVLKVIGVAGLLATVLVAPNVLRVLPLFLRKGDRRKRYYPSYLTRVARRLRDRGLIRLTRKNSKSFYEITEKGREMLARYELQEFELPRPRRWDEKWRIFLFDIKESRKPTRENIRRILWRLGFSRLQDSVWVYPFECEEVMELLRTGYGVRHEAIYLTANRFLKDRWLLKEYDLLKYAYEE